MACLLDLFHPPEATRTSHRPDAPPASGTTSFRPRTSKEICGHVDAMRALRRLLVLPPPSSSCRAVHCVGPPGIGIALTCELVLIESGYAPVRIVSVDHSAASASPFHHAMQLIAADDIVQQFSRPATSHRSNAALILKGYASVLSKREVFELCDRLKTCTLGAVVLVNETDSRPPSTSGNRAPPVRGSHIPCVYFTRPSGLDILAHLSWIVLLGRGVHDVPVSVLEDIARTAPDVVGALNALEGISAATAVSFFRDASSGASDPAYTFLNAMRTFANLTRISDIADAMDIVLSIEGLRPALSRSTTTPGLTKTAGTLERTRKQFDEMSGEDSRSIIAQNIDACGYLAYSALTVYSPSALLLPPPSQELFDTKEVRAHVQQGVLRRSSRLISFHTRDDDIMQVASIVHARASSSMKAILTDVCMHQRVVSCSRVSSSSAGTRDIDDRERMLQEAKAAVFALCRLSIASSRNASGGVYSASSIATRVKDVKRRLHEAAAATTCLDSRIAKKTRRRASKEMPATLNI